jgi:hypothetical protein
MPVIPVNKVVDQKRIIGKNGGPRRRKRHKGSLTQKKNTPNDNSERQLTKGQLMKQQPIR